MSSLRQRAKGLSLLLMLSHSSLKAAKIDRKKWLLWVLSVRVGDFAKLALDFKDFFKWIEQHLRIKRFLATSENAVRSQVWCAIATHVLIAIVKKELKLVASLQTCLQILSVSIFEKTEISCVLQPNLYRGDQITPSNQLNLFDI